jgi:choline dehydrogenase
VIEHHDVVVVGSGSTGGTVAARLAEDPACQVLLLEAGHDYPNEGASPPGWFTLGAMTGGSGPPDPSLDWGFVAEPVAPGGRPFPVFRGKVAGGSSMINGCVAVRGRPEDFSAWARAGAAGWDWESVLPHYEAAERELTLMTYPEHLWMPIQRIFVDACRELDFRYVEDMNAPDAWDQIVGPWPRNRRNEIRQGSLTTYIRRARERPNFQLRDRVHVDRVLLQAGRARGVTYLTADGTLKTAEADLVILSAGAYGTPPILLRSGIGPADELRALSIDPVVDLPVGRHLMDHPGLRFTLQVDQPAAQLGWPYLAVASRGLTYWGTPISVDQERGIVTLSFFLGLTDGPPGSVRLRSDAPAAAPVIDHAFGTLLGTDAFQNVWDDFRALLQTGPFREIGAADVQQGASLEHRMADGIRTGTHPAGGCAIGRVVDPDLNVYGIDRLRVADASIFPRHVTNNPNLTCHMVGEHLAAKLAGATSGESFRPAPR